MTILHIAAGLSFGGIGEVVAMLSMYQRKQGCDVTMTTVAAEDDAISDSVSRAVAAGVKLVQFRRSFPKALFFSWQMLTGLNVLIKEADVVHVHSNWTFPVWWACRLALKYKKKLVMTPHGCLSPERLTHSKWKKKAVGSLDRYFLRKADVIHATCESEAKDIKAFMALAGLIVATPLVEKGSKGVSCQGAKMQRKERVFALANELPQVVVIPNGVELEELDGDVDHGFWKKRYPEIGDRNVVLALGRLHPLKGLDLLIDAWAAAYSVSNVSGDAGSIPHSTSHIPHSTFNNWTLVIAGPDEQGTLEQLKSQVSKLNLTEHVLFSGVISAAERKDAIGSAQYLVLPSRHENFGLTVVEALACRVPVIATKGTPWSELLGFASVKVRECANARVNASEGAGLNAASPLVQEVGESSEVLKFESAKVCSEVCGSVEPNKNSSLIIHHSSLASSGRSGWWVAVGVGPLVQVLQEALALSDEKHKMMGENGRKLVDAKYQWKMIAKQMLAIYAAE